jgi:hypothetical protein
MQSSKVLIILSLSLTMILSACFPPYKPVSQAESEVEGLHFSRLEVKGKMASHDLFFVENGDSSKQMVLFIHGTPGSWQGYHYYLQAAELSSRAHLVAVDRPGFGQSTDEKWLPSFRDQASILIQLQKLNHSGRPMIVVGHSLGGSIAYRMAVDFPEFISSLVDFDNLKYAENNLSHARLNSVPVLDLGHFILWERPEIVIQEIVSLLD